MSEAERHDMVEEFRIRRYGAHGNRYGVVLSDSAWRAGRCGNRHGAVHTLQANQTGVLLIGVHFLTLESGADVWYGAGIGVYRPNDNPVIDLIQTNGRMRSNKSMIDRKDLKG
ncbi:MAG: hypothetical protein ACLR9W_10005 [Enterobacter hormaechei]